MVELLNQQIQQLLEIVSEQNDRIRVLESRVDSLEMSDPPAIKSLYETLMGNDSIDNFDTSVEDDIPDGIALVPSSDSTVPPIYSPPVATDSPSIVCLESMNTKPLQRYTRDEIIEIGRRWTSTTGFPGNQRKIERIPISQPVSVDSSILRDSNVAPSSIISSLRITIDNEGANNLSTPTAQKDCSDNPRKSFRQILEMYSSNNKSDRNERMESTPTAANTKTPKNGTSNNSHQTKGANNDNKLHSDSKDSCNGSHMKKNAHRVVKMQTHNSQSDNGSNKNNNRTNINRPGFYNRNPQTRQNSVAVPSNRHEGNATNKSTAKKETTSQDARVTCPIDLLTIFSSRVGPSRSEEELIRESSRLGTLVIHAPGDNNQNALIDA